VSSGDQDAFPLRAEEHERIRRSVETERALFTTLRKVMPDATDDEVGDAAHDLADLWELAVKHQQRVDAILQMTGAEHRQALADLLNDLLYCDVDIELRFHLESMRKVLPKLIEKLEARK
jgi:hypothetical protein